MKLTLLKTLFIFSLSSILLIGCKKEEKLYIQNKVAAPEVSNTSAKIGGAKFTSEEAEFAKIGTTGFSFGSADFGTNGAAHRYIYFVFNCDQTNPIGSYELGSVSYAYYIEVKDGVNTYYMTSAANPGTLKIDKFDEKKGTISGTYTFTATDNWSGSGKSVEVTGGKFFGIIPQN